MKYKVTLLILAVFAFASASAQITVNITASPGTTVCDNQSVTFTAAITGCTGPYTITWIQNGFNQDTCTSPCTTWTTTFASGNPMIWCNVNCSPQGTSNSNALTMSVMPCSGIEELQNGNLTTVYPNPATENITIEFSGSGNSTYTLAVFNQNGERMKVSYSVKPGNILFNAKQFSQGVYYYRIEDEKGKNYSAGKFVIGK
jgi:hypothetical protein